MNSSDISALASGLRCRSAKWLGRFHREDEPKYAPFVIVCTARTGSEFFKSLLNDHKNMIAWGALFAPASRNRIRWGFAAQPQRASLRRLILDDPVGFLEREIWTSYPSAIRAVGFKLFYGHARSGEWRSVWSYLQRRTDTRILHLRRQNLLARQVSLELAQASRIWRSKGRDRVPRSMVNLDFDACLREFRRVEEGAAEIDAMFPSERVINVVYENLAVDQAAEMQRVFDFLGVENRGVRASTRRQSGGMLKDQIGNFHELERRFRGSHWHKWFQRAAQGED
jgi:LPS sulfotransferase NodH